MFSMIFPTYFFSFAGFLLLCSTVLGFCPTVILFHQVLQWSSKQKVHLHRVLSLRELDFLVEPIGAFDVPRAAQEQGARIE